MARVGSSPTQLLERTAAGVLLYGLTPPRLATTAERAHEIAAATLARLASVELDALILYDVDAEADRSPDPRPFPFMPMMDPATFLDRHLSDWPGPVIVYRAVSKYTQTELSDWFTSADPDRVLTVLVGAASRHQVVTTRLADAYQLHAALPRRPVLGGVLIAERHAARADEHQRMLRKQARLPVLRLPGLLRPRPHPKPVDGLRLHLPGPGSRTAATVLTLAPCGSMTTLEFMSWLGIDIPRWLRTQIVRSGRPPGESYHQCLTNARTLIAFVAASAYRSAST